MKKKKVVAKLAKTKRKLAKTRNELDEMLGIIEASGMPKASSKPAVGKVTEIKSAPPVKKTAVKPAAKKSATKKTV